MPSYVVAYLTELEIVQGAGGGLEGPACEIMVAVASATANADGSDPIRQQIHYPLHLWYEARDGHDLLKWSHPGVGPSLAGGRPWGMPLFVLEESRMRDRMSITISVLDEDRPVAAGVVEVTTRVLPHVAGAAVTIASESATAGTATAAVGELVLAAVRDSWTQDVVGVHANVFSREQDWGIRPEPIVDQTSADGTIRVAYHIERITVPDDLRVRARLNRISIGESLDDWYDARPSSDVYAFARSWGGHMAGEIPQQRLERFPASGDRDMSGGEAWELDANIWEGPVGPFLFLEMAAWDYDSTNEDDMHGTIFGLWRTPDLLRQFQSNGWQPIRFNGVSRGRPLAVDFTIEPLDPMLIPLTRWTSESRLDSVTTTHPSWQRRPGDQPSRSPDYDFRQTEGHVINPAIPQPPGTVPLFSLYSKSRADNFLTTDPRYAGPIGAFHSGYFCYRHEGWIYSPDLPQPPHTMPLYSWWRSAPAFDNLCAAYPPWDGPVGATRDGYTCYRLEGYISGGILI